MNKEKTESKIDCAKHGVQMADFDGRCPKCEKIYVPPLQPSKKENTFIDGLLTVIEGQNEMIEALKPPSKKEKVYCRFCKHLIDKCPRDERNCIKVIVKQIGSAYSPDDKYEDIIFDYESYNKNNDCKYYEYKKYEGI